MHDPLFVDPKEIPADTDYQWVSLSVCGDEKLGDFERMKEMGWRPVPYDRHPRFNDYRERLLSFDKNGEKTLDEQRIVIQGLVLVERNMKLTERAKLEERDKADAQMGYARGMRQYRESIPTDFRMGYDLPDDDRGIEPNRRLALVSHYALNGAYTWTDKLTFGLWLSGWRYVPADRHVEYFAATKDPQRKLVLFYDRDKPRYLIARRGDYSQRPAADWLQRLMFWKRR
jgi:hypothetical protein